MRILLVLIIGVLIGVAGYWLIERRDADVKVEAKGSVEGERISVSGRDLKDQAEDVGEELKEAGRKAADVAGDATITAAVKAKLAAHPDLSARKINVDTEDGVVTLRGQVATEALKERAAEVAREIPGVKEVKTDLRVEL